MNPQDLHNELAAALANGADRDAAINTLYTRIKELAGQAQHSLDARSEAMSLGVAVKGSLLRAWTDIGTLAFADYGRHLETMERLGLAKAGVDFQGAPITMLTTKGLQQAALLQGYARALHGGIPWHDAVRHGEPSARESEQKALWGDTAYRGVLGADQNNQRVWSNGHMAMLWPDNEKHLPAKFRGNATATTIPARSFDRVWPQDMAQRERIDPVAVSGTLNSAKASVTEARQVWFSNGQTADARYVDAILREYPDASFHADPRQARRGSIAITVPHGDGHQVVGVCMPTSTGYLMHAMPEGVGKAMDAHWLAKGVDPRAKALERAMQEQMHRFANVNGFYNTALRSGGRNIVLRGHWNEEPTAHPVLQWDVLTNQQLRSIAKHTQVLSFGFATPQHVEQCKHMDPKDLVQRWQREATLVELERDGQAMAMTDGLGRRASLDTIEKVEQYKRERALPEWLGADVLHELRYAHEAQDSQAFTPARERTGPPVAIDTRVRWTANPPNVGCIEGLLTQCDQSQAGNWRLTIATRRYDGEPMEHRMWTNEGTVQEAGWSIARDFRYTHLVEPSGEHRLVESAQDLEDIVHGIAIEDRAMAHYADALRTQWWQSRTLDEYKEAIDSALQEGFGVSVEEGLYSDGLKAQRDLGLSPLAVAHVVGTRLKLTPVAMQPGQPAQGPFHAGLVQADGLAWNPQPKAPEATPTAPTHDWTMRP